MMNNPEKPFIVEDLKQYLYCPRIVFYAHCMPGIRPRTFSMDAGHDDHQEARHNARRRTFTQMGVENGQREFDVDIVNAELNLHGRLDEVVTTDTGEVFPVDYKATDKVADNHRMQLAAYATLLEADRHVTVNRGYIYLIPLRKARLIKIGHEDKQTVFELLETMTAMVAEEVMPPPTSIRSRCHGCEFRRFCNDV
jgi:CRISPR-associated exonuclease Cas4